MNLGGVPERLTQFMFIRKFIQKRILRGHLGELKKCGDLGVVSHDCNPSYLRGGAWNIMF
jgi:hypothetical protein